MNEFGRLAEGLASGLPRVGKGGSEPRDGRFAWVGATVPGAFVHDLFPSRDSRSQSLSRSVVALASRTDKAHPTRSAEAPSARYGCLLCEPDLNRQPTSY